MAIPTMAVACRSENTSSAPAIISLLSKATDLSNHIHRTLKLLLMLLVLVFDLGSIYPKIQLVRT